MKKIVDARGLACPLPVINTKKTVEEMNETGTVEVIVDNDIAVQNIEKYLGVKKLKHNVENISNDEFHIIIELDLEGQESLKNTPEPPIACDSNISQKGGVVVISSRYMGNGDDVLGAMLMKSFIFALTKQDILPDTILLYNSGAFLSCTDSESLEDLKNLQSMGVKIMTCGTCLNFYGISEKLEVGSVTNMYEIVEEMMKGSKIIKP